MQAAGKLAFHGPKKGFYHVVCCTHKDLLEWNRDKKSNYIALV